MTQPEPMTTPAGPPPEAITAAMKVTLERFPNDHESLARDDVTAILEAAGPHLNAAERERCAQLAEQHEATYLVPCGKCALGDACRGGLAPFADLLRREGGGG